MGTNFRRHRENRENLTIVNWSMARARQDRSRDSKAMTAAVQSNKSPTTYVMSVAKFERFFRIAAGLNVDKQDLKRYSDFINQKVYDLLLRAEATAKANGRLIIEPFDLPITKGLQESIHEFKKIDEQIELQPILDQLTARPPLDLAYDEDTESQLPEVVGGLSLALARLQDHWWQSEEPGNRALAEVLPHFRSADVALLDKLRFKPTPSFRSHRRCSPNGFVAAFVVEPGGSDDQGCDGLAGWRYLRRNSSGGCRRNCPAARQSGDHRIVSQSLAVARPGRRGRQWRACHGRAGESRA
jgi:hypothetical protein